MKKLRLSLLKRRLRDALELSGRYWVLCVDADGEPFSAHLKLSVEIIQTGDYDFTADEDGLDLSPVKEIWRLP